MRKVKSFGDRRRRHCFLWPVLLAGALVSTPSRAGELEVPSALYDRIAEALEAAADGDEIVLVNGTYGGPGNRDIYSDNSAPLISYCTFVGNGAYSTPALAGGGRFTAITVGSS
jgi:hypothetical protein